MLTGEPVEISRGQAEQVSGLGVVSRGGDDVEMGVLGGQFFDGGFGFGESFDRFSGEGRELGPVRCDPRHKGEELLVKELESLRWEEGCAGGGAEDWVEDDGDPGGGLIPYRRVPFRKMQGG